MKAAWLLRPLASSAPSLHQGGCIMAGVLDILGSLLDGGMKKSTATRVEHSLSDGGVGGSGGILAEMFGGSAPAAAAKTAQPKAAQGAAGGTAGSLGEAVGSILGDRTI